MAQHKMAHNEHPAEEHKETAESSEKGKRPSLLEIVKITAMPLVTAVLGFAINYSLDSRQAHETNTRLYADMMGRREESDSALRKDMFRSILDTFMQKDPNMKPQQFLDLQVLDLELLAYNFHESLDLGPLFKHVRRRIPNDETDDNIDQRARLEKVALEVSERQMTALADSGKVVRGGTEPGKIRDGTAYLTFFGPYTVASKAGGESHAPRLCLSLNAGPKEDHYRQFKLEVIDYEPSLREVQARLYVSRPLNASDCQRADLDLVSNREVDTTFWVGLFAFPMIDNTHLSHAERCAVSVTMLNPDALQLAISYFPGSRASLKDKPYYDELMHDLLRSESLRDRGKH